MLNFKEIENRIKIQTGLSESKDIAALFKMTPQNYSNKKGLGTLLPVIVEWAVHEKVNLDWLMRGEEEKKAGPDLLVKQGGHLLVAELKMGFQSDLEEMLLRILKEGDNTKKTAVRALLSALDPGKKGE